VHRRIAYTTHTAPTIPRRENLNILTIAGQLARS